MQSLPKYQNCDWSLFISYSHTDNRSNDQWVTSLRNAIWNRMSKLERFLEKAPLPIHFSEENGPSAGHLSKELKQRVEKSFAMLLVVGEDYVESTWCEKELQLFADIFGGSGFASRLYVLVMTQNDLNKASKGKVWEQNVAPDQLWKKLYDDKNPNKPIKPGAIENGFERGFLTPVEAIADHLIQAIKEDWKNGASEYPDSKIDSVSPSLLGIAPFSSDLEPAIQELIGKLDASGFKYSVFDRGLIERYDPDDDSSCAALRDALRQVDRLLVPFQETVPMLHLIPGGHLAVLKAEWKKLSKQHDIFWYKPVSPMPEGISLGRKHQEFINSLHAVYLCPEDMVAALTDPLAQSEDSIKIRIQNHPEIKVFDLLKRTIDGVWQEIKKETPFSQSPQPRLDLKPLDLRYLDVEDQKDSYGYVVVKPVFIPQKSLKAKMDKIEKTFAKGINFNGRIALIFREDDQNVAEPEIDWLIIQCKQSGGDIYNPNEILLNEVDKREIRQFLKTAWQDYSTAREH